MYEYSEERLDTLLRVISCDMDLLKAQTAKMTEDSKREYLAAIISAVSIAERALTEAFCIAYHHSEGRSKKDE